MSKLFSTSSSSTLAVALTVVVTLLIIIAISDEKALFSYAQQLVQYTVGTYDPLLKALDSFPNLRPFPGQSISFATSAFHFHLFDKITPGSASTSFDTLPIAAAPVCLAYNSSAGIVRTQMTLQTLSDWLTGTVASAPISSSLEATTINTDDLTVFIAPTSPTSKVITQAMNFRGISGWTDPNAFPATVLGNANHVFVGTDEDVFNYLQNTTNAFGFISLGFGVGLQCSDIELSDTIAKKKTVYSPRLPDDVFAQLDFSATQAKISSRGNAYPFIGPLLFSVLKVSSCSLTRLSVVFDSAVQFFTNPSFKNVLTTYGFAPISPIDQLASLRTLYESLPCVDITTVRAVGSVAIAKPMSSWILQYVQDKSLFVDYSSQQGFGDATGVNLVRDGLRELATTERVFSSLERRLNPEIKFVPAVASSVSVVVNLPGIESIILDRCTLVRIFRGLITRWDDPLIVASNPSIRLPSEIITRVQRTDDDGSASVFNVGSSLIADVCGSIPPSVDGIGTSATRILIGNFSGFTSYVTRNPFVITYMPTYIAQDYHFTTASIRDETSKTMTVPTLQFVQNALLNATIDTATDSITFKVSPDAYPFVGISYWVFSDNPLNFNCSSIRQAYDFAIWSVSDSAARELTIDSGFIPLTSDLVNNGITRIRSSRCKNSALYPVPVESSISIPLIAGTGGAGLILLIVGVVLFSHWFSRRGLKSDRFAVKSSSEPLCAVFTDIQSSTTLWSCAPEHMGPALDLHNKIIREVLEKHHGYEVKTIGDAFFNVFAKASDAMKFALDCQVALHKADWGTDELDIVYARLYGDKNSPFNNETIYQNRLDPELFNGLLIRIGIHGMGCCEFKEENGIIDYSGTVINTTARCEAAGHGGQIVCTAEVIKEINETDPSTFDDAVVTDLGLNALRGLPEPVELIQILPSQFGRRLFPPLRLDQTGKVDEDDDDDDDDSTTFTGGDVHNDSMNSNLVSDFGGGDSTRGENPRRKSSTASKPGVEGGSASGSTNGTGSVVNIAGSSNASTGGSGGVGKPTFIENSSSGSTSDQNNNNNNNNNTVIAADERFVRFMSAKAKADPNGTRRIYIILKNTLSPFHLDRKKLLLQDIIKEWRLSDMKSKSHKQFKQDLGFDIYWLIRIAVKVQTVLAVQRQQLQDHRNSTSSYDANSTNRRASHADHNETGSGGSKGDSHPNLVNHINFTQASVNSVDSSQSGSQTDHSGADDSAIHVSSVHGAASAGSVPSRRGSVRNPELANNTNINLARRSNASSNASPNATYVNPEDNSHDLAADGGVVYQTSGSASSGALVGKNNNNNNYSTSSDQGSSAHKYMLGGEAGALPPHAVNQ